MGQSLQQQITKLLRLFHSVAVLGGQWGDEGKGKLVDIIAAYWADVIARGMGGPNAGHTVHIGPKTFALHLLPSGIIHDTAGKISIIGHGVAFDPAVCCRELNALDADNMSYDNLMIAFNAPLILPQHILLDSLPDAGTDGNEIGTTKRGVGPCYTDIPTRWGLKVVDLLNPEVFKRKLQRNFDRHYQLLKTYDVAAVKSLMLDPYCSLAGFYNADHYLDLNAIATKYLEYGQRLKRHVSDTDAFMKNARQQGKRILFEGAQGLLLDILYGTHPFVTSSESSVHGVLRGVGLGTRDCDTAISAFKAPYMTRVGEGPFPTELGGLKSALHCSNPAMVRAIEERDFGQLTVNEEDEYLQGIGIRKAGIEYGTTTGRPRRVGWLDLVLLKHAVSINGLNMAMMKLDVLDACKVIRICISYTYEGPEQTIATPQGSMKLTKGYVLKEIYPDPDILMHCKPNYIDRTGWCRSTTEISDYRDLPVELKHLIHFVASEVDGIAPIMSVGPDRNQTIIQQLPLRPLT